MDSSELTVSADRVEGFLQDTLAAFAQAKARRHCSQYRFLIAGYIIQLEVVGAELESLLAPALLHCQIDPAATSVKPDLTIYAFDSVTTGVPMARPVWAADAYTRKEVLKGFATEHIRAAYNLASGVFNIQDSAIGVGVYWVQDANDRPRFEQSAPLRVQLFWWLREQNRQLIHGGAVAQGADGILLVGRGGSGKSTSAIACLNDGWRYIGDDYILFGLEPQPTAYNVYQTAKLNVEHLFAHFPQLADAIYGYTKPDRSDKAILMLQDRFSQQIASECRIKAVVLPKVSPVAAPRIVEVDPQTTLAALVSSTVRQLPPIPSQDIRKLIRLVNSVPNYRLEIAGSPQAIPAVLGSLV